MPSTAIHDTVARYTERIARASVCHTGRRCGLRWARVSAALRALGEASRPFTRWHRSELHGHVAGAAVFLGEGDTHEPAMSGADDLAARFKFFRFLAGHGSAMRAAQVGKALDSLETKTVGVFHRLVFSGDIGGDIGSGAGQKGGGGFGG